MKANRQILFLGFGIFILLVLGEQSQEEIDNGRDVGEGYGSLFKLFAHFSVP